MERTNHGWLTREGTEATNGTLAQVRARRRVCFGLRGGGVQAPGVGEGREGGRLHGWRVRIAGSAGVHSVGRWSGSARVAGGPVDFAGRGGNHRAASRALDADVGRAGGGDSGIEPPVAGGQRRVGFVDGSRIGSAGNATGRSGFGSPRRSDAGVTGQTSSTGEAGSVRRAGSSAGAGLSAGTGSTRGVREPRVSGGLGLRACSRAGPGHVRFSFDGGRP